MVKGEKEVSLYQSYLMARMNKLLVNLEEKMKDQI
jgi:hypothetical protein